MLYNQFEDEAAFRDQFVRPLLNRLGFLSVAELHGSQEFGKDFVFSELQRLGGLRHLGCQVKHEKTINQGRSVDGILTQIRQTFARPFRLPDSPRERYISAVYVFNSGKITQNAQAFILDSLKQERYGDNVHFFDGQRLEDLNRWSTFQEDRYLRQRLNGLLLQAHQNRDIWTHARASAADSKFYFHGSFLHGIEEFLSNPVDDAILPSDLLMRIWKVASIVDGLNRKYGGHAFHLGEGFKNAAQRILSLSTTLLEWNADLINQIEKALARLKQL